MLEKVNKHKWSILLFLIVFLSIAFGLHFFNINSTIWWDSADYLAGSKVLAGMDNTNYEFNPHRPILMALLWAGLLLLGFGETALHFTIFLFSLALVIFTYLLGKEMFNKKVGVIASFMMCCFWLQLFLTARLLVIMPGVSLAVISLYFFWKGYIKKGKMRYVILFAVFLALSFLARAQSLLAILIVGFFMLLTERHKLFVNKRFWVALVILFLVLLPYIIFLETGRGGVTGLLDVEQRTTELIGFRGLFDMAKALPGILTTSYLIVALFGLIVFFKAFIVIDEFFKREKRLYAPIFLFLWIFAFIIHIAAFIRPIGYIEPYYIFYAFPLIFIVGGKGIELTYNFIKKYNKAVSFVFVGLVIGLLLFGAYTNVKSANQNIMSKKDSYLPVKTAGLWLKENTQEDAVIISRSWIQTLYYAERTTHNYPSPKDNVTLMEELMKESDFLIVSIYEKHPEYIYKYPQEHADKLIPVQVYESNGQPTLVIYKIQGGLK